MKIPINNVMSITVIVISVVIVLLYIYREPVGNLVYDTFEKHNGFKNQNQVVRGEVKNLYQIPISEKDPKIIKKAIKELPYDFIQRFYQSKDHKLYKSIAKNGHNVPETKVELPFMYYFPGTLTKIDSNSKDNISRLFKWNVKNNWLLRDVTHDKYYSPEGLIQIDKGLVFEWEPLQGLTEDEELEFYIIQSKL
jgi:hypothetical protein